MAASPNESAELTIESVVQLLATNARLLVATDFDGTISYYETDPTTAQIVAEARVALRQLSELPNTYVAIISGRSLADLSSKYPKAENVRLVGSHGHEFDLDKVAELTTEQSGALKQADILISSAVERCPGTRIERKPHGVAFHYRGLTSEPAEEVQRLCLELKKIGVGLVRTGKMVVEYCVVTTGKGDALSRLREQTSPTIALYIGDDETDEEAFSRMNPSDVSVKVGPGETAARLRVKSTQHAVELIVKIAERRLEWMRNIPAVPIDNHLFLSDLRTVALVDNHGTLNWMCIPRIDGTPLFGSLVGGPGAGHFRISCGGPGVQSYIDGTLVGQTQFDHIKVTDLLDCSFGRSFQRAGRTDLVRRIEGRGEVVVEFAPKFNFGRVPTRLHIVPEGLRVECGQQLLLLASPNWDWEIKREGNHDVATSTKTFNDERSELTLLVGTAVSGAPPGAGDRMLASTVQFWREWIGSIKLPETHRQLVAQSALVIRGLIYGPTGAIAAAGTTSLPETIGGVRNWDYRYCWPRDASLAASALVRLNALGPAMRLLDWILGIVFDSDDKRFLAPLYTVTGRSIPGEAEIPEAVGYRGSRPVRTGNLAADQLQLDTLGPIAELMLRLATAGASLTSEHLRLADILVALVEARWRDEDSGIWEMRSTPRHYVHSKLMCWYTVRCCISIAQYLGVDRSSWSKLLDSIRDDIEAFGFSTTHNSYVAAYDLEAPDSSLLWIILSGFHPPAHPRSLGTLKYIQDSLIKDDNVYRYNFDDSLHGREGEFIICRCWMIEALALCERREDAEFLLNSLLRSITPLGLLSEQRDAIAGLALGNYPQAYSHTGLINAILSLSEQ